MRQDATAKEASYADFLDTLLTEEIASKIAKARHHADPPGALLLLEEPGDLRLHRPALARLEADPDAESCHFIEHGENVVLLGPPSVGKSHLAVGLGLKAIETGYRVLFATAVGLITALTKAAAEGRLDDRLKVYTVHRPAPPHRR